MKILSISNCPLLEFQGSGYAILNFSQALRDRGHQVDLYSPENFELFHTSVRAKQYRQALGMLFFVLYKISKNYYDIIEFYGAESWLTVSILSKIRKRQFSLVSHSNGIEPHVTEEMLKYFNNKSIDGNPRKWYQLDQSWLFEKAFTEVDGIVTVSEYDRNYALKQNYQDDSHILTIEHGLPKGFIDLKVEFSRKPIVGYCGSWIARKGIKTIQTDVPRLLREFPNCSFKLIGVGSHFQKEAFFNSEICSRIEIIPFVENKGELQNIYQSISILIVPSIYESFGLVIAEAMACGCAVVANNTGWAASLKQGEEAMIIEEPVSPLLYKSVKELLLNESLRLQIAKAGYQRVQSLRWDSAVDRLEKIYQKWLKELNKG